MVLDQFYDKRTSSCKSCHAKKPKKFKVKCVVCESTFNTKSRYNVFCSAICTSHRRKQTRGSREHELLPNYLTEDFKG